MASLSKDKRNQLILVIMVTVALMVGLWYGVINTRTAELTRIQSARVKTIENLDKARKVISRAAQADSDMQRVTNKLAAVEETMASGDLYSWTYLFLEKARAGQDVNFIDVGRPTRGDVSVLAQFPYAAAIFNVRGTAYYHDFGRFLADFENKYPYYRIQNLTLVPGYDLATGSDSGTETKLTFRMDFVTLIQPNQ